MYRYTTPTLPITIEDIDFTEVNVFRIAIEQGNIEMLKIINADDESVDAETNTIYVPLTQEETASFKEGSVYVQARIVFTAGAVMATAKAKVSVKDVLDEVIV